MARRTNAYFAGKLIVITGGTSGIGFALAEELLRRNRGLLSCPTNRNPSQPQ